MNKQQIAQQHASQQRLLITTAAQSLEVMHLSLHDKNPVTGDEDGLSALFYEYYRGYTIYSNAQGGCAACMGQVSRDACVSVGSMSVFLISNRPSI